MFHKVVFSQDVRLSYAVGRIKALENYMLPKTEMERFTEMPDSQLEKILDEYHYSFDIGDDIFNNQHRDYSIVTKFLKPIKEYQRITKLILLKNDFINIKNYLKKRKTKQDNKKENYQLDFYPGLFTQDTIEEIVEKQKFYMIDESQDLILMYFKKIYQDYKSVWIEHYLDQLYSDLFFNELVRLQNNYLIFYYKNYLDLTNIENLIRFKILNKSIDEYNNVFYKNSFIKWIDIKEIYSKKTEEFPEQFKVKPYYSVVRDGIGQYLDGENFNIFELKKDNFLLEILKLSKIASFGIEPLFGYLWGKNIEYKNLRIIIEGRKRRLKQSKIKELLRETYV